MEDETLHSLYVRHYLVGGYARVEELTHRVFGRSKTSVLHDFPNDTEAFALRSSNIFGAAEDILLNHTNLPIYRKFQTEKEYAMLLKSLMGSTRTPAIANLLRRQHRPFSSSTLRFCEECVKKDHVNAGFPHWRNSHQVPGVYRCSIHHIPLAEVSLLHFEKGKCLHLPIPERLSPRDYVVAIATQQAGQEENLKKIADVANFLASLCWKTRLDKNLLRTVYRHALRDRGYIRANTVVRRVEADAALVEFGKALNVHAGMPNWFSDAVVAGNLTVTMTSSSAWPTQPIFHAVFIAWLFPSWADFVRTYENTTSLAAETKPLIQPLDSNKNKSRNGGKKQAFVALISEGVSVQDARKQLSVSTLSASRWSVDLLTPDYTDKTYPPELRLQLTRRLAAGDDLETISEALGIVVSTVQRFVTMTPGLAQKRKKGKQKELLRLAIKSWVTALKRHRNGDSYAKTLARNDQKLIIKYDKAKYETIMINYPCHNSWTHRSDTDWIDQDAEFARQVLAVGKQLRREDSKKKPQLWDVVKALEDNGAPRLKSERFSLPEAKQALASVLGIRGRSVNGRRRSRQ